MRQKLGRLLAGIIVILIIFFVARAITAEPFPDHPFISEGRVLVTAHRGGRGLWPENTIFAFEQAAKLGVDVLESDVHSTADGILVLMHDDDVDRTTDGSGPINSYSWAELQKLDAGYRWNEDESGTFPYREQGITVPTLQELFETFPDYLMSVEIKQTEPAIAEPICQMIRDYNRADRTLVGSFDADAVKAFRRVCPEVATAATANEVLGFLILSTFFLDATSHSQAEIFFVPEKQGPITVVTRRFVESAQKRNASVNVWTVNEPADMRRMVELGVDSITTDYPDRLLELLAESDS